MIDLKPFCSREETRYYIQQPFSRGEWTYATNGHIMIRVPRVADYPEVNDLPEAAAKVHRSAVDLFNKYPLSQTMEFPPIEWPEPPDDDCAECDGRGTEHDCPECKCVCWRCDGSGTEPPFIDVSVEIGGTPFAAKYVHLLQQLPSIEVSARVDPKDPMPFRFAGGEGLLCPERSPGPTYIRTQYGKHDQKDNENRV